MLLIAFIKNLSICTSILIENQEKVYIRSEYSLQQMIKVIKPSYFNQYITSQAYLPLAWGYLIYEMRKSVQKKGKNTTKR